MRLKIANGIVITALILTIFIAGCTSTQSGVSNDSVSINAKAVQSPQSFSLNNKFGDSIKPAAGNKFVMYNVTFTNINANSRQMQAAMFTVQDINNNSYVPYYFGQGIGPSNSFPTAFTVTQPGSKYSGNLVYDVPQNVKLVTMTYDDHFANQNGLHIVTSL